VSKEVKPREFWIQVGADNLNLNKPYKRYLSAKPFGGSVGDEDYPNCEVIHVIEYTPEVKRAVECHKDLLEALELAMHLLDEDKNPASTNRIKGAINQAKGQA
jgi:hypothetical protein